jgi:hypothetical protein
MSKGLFEFHWEVPEGGYRWVDSPLPGNEDTLPVLIPQSARPRPARRYAPLEEETGLFRILADVELSREGLLTFANRYGCLGNTRVTVLDPKSQEFGQIPHRSGETWPAWVGAVQSLQAAVRLWEMAQKGDEAGLAQHVRWVDDDSAYCVSDSKWLNVPLEDPLPIDARRWGIRRSWEEEWLKIRPGDRVALALHYVQMEINQHLRDIGARLLWDRTHTRQELCFVPTDLLAAIWLQFAQAVDGNKGYQSCLQCGRWFELSPKMARADKQFCTGACRSRAARERQLQAGQLFEAGQTIAEIASTLHSTPTVVQRWIDRQAQAAVSHT